VRDFRSDYQRTSPSYVKIEGYAPFRVAELRDQQRIQVELNLLAQTFGVLVDPVVLLGLSNGIPSASAHEAAAQAHLANTGRSSCSIVDAAVSPNGRQFEFRYTCP
jgi:hypothetical protein